MDKKAVQLTGLDPLYLEVFSPAPIQELPGLALQLEIQRIAEEHSRRIQKALGLAFHLEIQRIAEEHLRRIQTKQAKEDHDKPPHQ